MNRLLLSGIAVSASLFAGCVESTLNPTDTVVVTGKALNEDKTPLADATLKLHRSLNSVCLLPDHYKDLQTDRSGAWSHQLTGAETQNGELARCFDLRVPATEKGAAASVRFLMQVTEIDVPEVQLWSGAVAADNAGPGAAVSFKKIAETHDFDADANLTLTLGSHPAWMTPAPSSPVALSEYVLEDFDGLKARLAVSRELRGSGTRFDADYTSDVVTLDRKTKVPASRGMACQFGAKTFDAGACPVTDGKLEKALPADAAADLRIDFAQPVKLRKLVLREFSYTHGSNLIIEGSSDGGVNFEPLVTVGTEPVGAFSELDLDASAPAVNAFRIRATASEGEPKILGVRQVSLFE